MRHMMAGERRRRIAHRHRIAPVRPASDVAEATAAMVALHATDPATVYLSARARVPTMTIADLDQALYEDRSLIKHLAMRRTLFVLPRSTLAPAQAGASQRVAAAERRRLVRHVERAGLFADGAAWLQRTSDAVAATLADGRQASSSQLRDEIPSLQGSIVYGEGRRWGGATPIGPRVLTVLSAEGRIVRATNDGGWNVSRPRWASMSRWLGEPISIPDEAEGVAALVGAWLLRFGPGTERDLVWWLGQTKRAVRGALTDVGAVEVELDDGLGYVHPDDLAPSEPVEPWGALLPALDPTTMGWADRSWYLGEHGNRVFDSNGNAGPTAWWDGRIVGGWRQDEDGVVELQLLEDVGSDGRGRLDAIAQALTVWLEGQRVRPRFPSPLFASE